MGTCYPAFPLSLYVVVATREAQYMTYASKTIGQ